MSETPTRQSAAARPSNRLAIATLVVGIAAFLIGLVPWLGLILGLTAFGLGIYALTRGQSKVMALVGGSLGSIAAVTGLISTSALMMWLLSGNA
ncbi:hypothetical protein [Microbacterium oleivorans]|nr:hypothetical protein [Microbacterium oleivorans]